MFSSDDLPVLDRRALMRNAILLVGGSLAASPAGAFAKPAARAKPARFFTPAQMAAVTEVIDIMVPRTDTPGAKDAGVPKTLDALMINWASAERQAQFRAMADSFRTSKLMTLPKPQRIELVRAIDAEKLKAWDPAYVKFKDLVLTLYYLSEMGATKELRFELIPGKFEPWTEIADDARAWAV